MNREETAKILTEASLIDNRRITDAHVEQWWRTLNDLTFAECQIAVVEHYKASRDWIQPSNIRAIVKKRREDAAQERHSKQLESAYSPKAEAVYPGKPSNLEAVVAFYRDLQEKHPRPAGMDPDEHARNVGLTPPRLVWE